MKTFYIQYLNPDSPANGDIFLVREVDYLPHHYLQSDGLHTAGDGRLLKKYCKPLNNEKP